MPTRTPPRAGSLALLIGIGLAGAVALAIATLRQPFATPVVVLLAFWGLGTTTRIMAFPLYRGRVIAFDSAYLIAAGIVLGWVPGAWIVVATMTADVLVQRYRGWIFDLPRMSSRERLAQTLFSTFGNALLLLGIGALLERVGLSPLHVNRHTAVFVVTPLALVTFVVCHYHIAFAAAVLNRDPPRSAYRQLVVPGIIGECLLAPLAMVMVLVYQTAYPAPFTLLATTVLVINAGFFIASQIGQRLRDRVRDLSMLNAVSKALTRNLELDPLLAALAGQLFEHFVNANAIVLGLRDVVTGSVRCALFGERDARPLERTPAADEQLFKRLVAERRSLRIRKLDYRQLDPVLTAPDAKSWLGVPMIVNDDVVGFINLQSSAADAFRRAEERMLAQVAAQAAIAVENARLFRLATVDGLTGLFVRRYFDQRLDEECLRAQRFDVLFSLLMLDIDDFKQINDTRGHATGDRVLRETAHVIRASLRVIDIAARYGGEEFVVLLPRADASRARQVAERIRCAVFDNDLAGVNGSPRVTVSIGVATFPDHAVDAGELVRAADRALYRAKAAGKNRVEGAINLVPDAT
ncbi:MAG: sensor domain-containing diguanylate cyclase [Deltaproteobacteria bacterium]|nr:sensor domain-containing diguanylate cyclase [Deltaproteobacteria bacterium]